MTNNTSTSEYHVIGLMSGTSMDGVDIAYCKFIIDDKKQWLYEVLQAECIPYPRKWEIRLRGLLRQNTVAFLKTNVHYGHLLGEMTANFMERHQLIGKVDFIASHGQTIFHQPESGMTVQIGCGAAIAAKTHLSVVADLRSMDIAFGGQGAPIVPIGDKHLFANYRFCLNIGGIANISAKLPDGGIIGYDICGANLLLNHLAGLLNLGYDAGGQIAATGILNLTLLEELNAPFYFEKPYPKSLSAGWVGKTIMPILDKYAHLSPASKMRTAVEHIAQQIGKEIRRIAEREGLHLTDNDAMLVTGGGALNDFLVSRIAHHSPIEVVVPDAAVVKFKEAIVMAFIGVLRMRQTPNCLGAVTGASRDTIGGCIYWV